MQPVLGRAARGFYFQPWATGWEEPCQAQATLVAALSEVLYGARRPAMLSVSLLSRWLFLPAGMGTQNHAVDGQVPS